MTLLLAALCLFVGPDIVQERDGLGNAFRKLAGGEYTSVVWFGGSITAGAGSSRPEFCYRELMAKRLKELYPRTPINAVNAAIGGTDSWLGAFRLAQHVLQHGPALVIVEFAVNDGSSPEPTVLAAMEGIVRQCRARNPDLDLLFVYTLVKNHMDAFKKGGLPERMQWHEKVAAHYGIPSVNMAAYAAQKILAGELTFDEFAKDGVHPTDRGYALYMDALRPYLDRCKAAAEAPGAMKQHPLPPALGPSPMERAKLVPVEWAALDDGWKQGRKSPVGEFLHVVQGERPGATATLRFKGEGVGYFDALGPDSGDFEVSLDGGDWKPRHNFDQFAKNYYRAHSSAIFGGLDPKADHVVKLRIAETKDKESKGTFARLGWWLVDGEAVDERIKPGATPVERLDAVYATMAPLAFEPAPDRGTLLPETMKRLREGPSLRIVMLGDSIIQDTASSKFELLLERMYPKCKVEKIVSARGSTGCWWYKQENRVQAWVLDHRPDLLMIGGISQNNDAESVRELIRQVREKSSPEILVMTGAVTTLGDPKLDPTWTYEVDPKGDGYRSKLFRMAAEEKVEFLDMTGPWGRYIRASEPVRQWYMRDPVHANERGFQVLGRILEKYFSPK
ncbi:MAG: SGNH/GDSL hydrolase family protein [Planctomycetaceae bacterium]|nr:SGNH/GDSL hydrolase family protein [Planctomycetaceae bacterium]